MSAAHPRTSRRITRNHYLFGLRRGACERDLLDRGRARVVALPFGNRIDDRRLLFSFVGAHLQIEAVIA